MGRTVVSLEFCYDNVLRIHKAATLENLTGQIVLVTNAKSNKPNEIKLVSQEDENVTRQTLKQAVVNRSMNASQDTVETIRLDDLVEYLPRPSLDNATTIIRQQAIMKIDIKGFEPYAFQNASKLFTAVDICVVFMRWEHKVEETRAYVAFIGRMVKFLKERGLQPYAGHQLLTNSWRLWGLNIVWRRPGF
jgi:hypothetical protein